MLSATAPGSAAKIKRVAAVKGPRPVAATVKASAGSGAGTRPMAKTGMKRGSQGGMLPPVKSGAKVGSRPAAGAKPAAGSSKSAKLPFRLPRPHPAAPPAPRKLSGTGGSAPAASKPVTAAAVPHARRRNPLMRVLAPVGALLSRLPLPKVGGKLLAAVAGGLAALAIVVIVVANSPLFAASEVVVNGSEHVTQQAAQQLVQVPGGTTLFNVNEDQVAEGLMANPWVMGVDIQREFPHKLIITPHERAVKAIAYITADDIAWAIGEDGAWIAPLSLSITVDANGAEVQHGEDGSLPEGAQQLSGLAAAQVIARRDGALLLTDVPSDIKPVAGESVSSEVVSAGLEYAKGFSADFLKQIKDLSVASVEAISANLTSGVEVSLGEPEDITEKERVVTKLLSQETGVTYINVREPGAYTFRSAPA